MRTKIKQFFLSIFKRQVLILEIEPVRIKFDEGTEEAIASLGSHPGFQALMAQMRVQQATLRQRLANAGSEPIEGLRHLQSGIYWLSWIEKQVQRATGKVESKTRPAISTELAAFEAAHNAVQIVGEE